LVTFNAQMSRPLSVCPSEIFFTIGSAASRSYCSSYCSLPSPATASERVHTSYPLSSPSGTAAAEALAFRAKGQAGENTTLVVVATDATLTKAQTRRLAMMAQDGMARALRPVHTPLDGDLVFAAATGARPLADPVIALAELGSLAADVVARAIARGVYEARALPFLGALPSWRDKFG